MSRKGESCRPSLECPLYPNCYEDEHHVVARRIGRRALKADMPEEYKRTLHRYIKHPMNLIVGCRWIHATQLDPATSNEFPDYQIMLNDLKAWGEVVDDAPGSAI